MKIIPPGISRWFRFHFLLATALLVAAPPTSAQNNPQNTPATNGKDLYSQLRSLSLGGGSAAVKELLLTRDRVQMIFDGTFYFATPIDGRVTGAVFVGNGKFKTDVPPSEFEKDNVKRLLGADVIESDFKTAIQ